MELALKKKTTSPVWTYFGLEKNEEGRIKTKDIAVCWKCYSHIHTKGSNTSDLAFQLKMHYPTSHGLVCSAGRTSDSTSYINEQQQQLTITSALNKAQKYGTTLLMLLCCFSIDSLPV